jgi:membrane protein DedA with SNARE-associated domain
MPYRRFLAANVAGALAWATTMGTLAYYFGKPVVALLESMGAWALAAVLAFLLARFAFKRWLRARESRLAAGEKIRPAVETRGRRKMSAAKRR